MTPVKQRLGWWACLLLAIVAAAGAVAATDAVGDASRQSWWIFAALAAVATVVVGYFTNLANDLGKESAERERAAKNHHLQLAIAESMQIALAEVRNSNATHANLFDKWDALLEGALEGPATLLAAVIPSEFQALLDAANPHLDQQRRFQSLESQLRFWLVYHDAFLKTGRTVVLPAHVPELPSDLRQSLTLQLLPAYEKALASLVSRDDATHARRQLERRALEEILARMRSLEKRNSLPLVDPHPPEPFTATSELEILRADNRSIPVVGRDSDLAGLHAWLASSAPISCRILTGRAGAGKTRLAIEFLDQLQGTIWSGGFLKELGDLRQRQWDNPQVVIIDYAATVKEPLKKWLEELSGMTGQQAPPHRLRVLLLEREADTESGWLRYVVDQSNQGELIAKLFDPRQPQRVTPISGIGLRQQILEATLLKVGAKASLPAPGANALFEQRLADSRWEDPLYLMMAVLAAQQGGLVQALSLTRTDLATRLADRELERIRKFVPQGDPPEAAEFLVLLAGIVTAGKVVEPADLLQAAKDECEETGFEVSGGPGVAVKRVTEALNRVGKAAPIEPDIIGEAALLRAFPGAEGTQALVRLARRAGHRFAGNVCGAIARTCQDFVSETEQTPLDWVEAFIQVGSADDLGLLVELEGAMPKNTLVLRERAARVDSLLLERSRALRGKAPSQAVESEIARFANNLSFRLRELGRREEALTMAEEAVRIKRPLAKERPDLFLPDLAGSLSNVGTMYSELGRREEGLEAVEEAVQIYRQTAKENPDAFLPDLAASLNNVGNRYGELGRREEALKTTEEAVQIRRQLAEGAPAAFLPDLAMSLDNAGIRYSELGRKEEGLKPTEEAAQIRRQLARERPDAFLPDLAMSLHNLGNRYSELGRREEGLKTTEEAVQIRRQLAKERPDAFLPDLAISLNSVGHSYSELGRGEEALGAAEDAVQIQRQLAKERPAAFLPALAISLNNVGVWYSQLGRREKALEAAEEAVQIRRQLAKERPAAFLPELASSLNNVGNRYSELGRREEALKAAEEAVQIRRQLAKERPAAFLPDLATSLGALGQIVGQESPTQAAAHFAEGMRLLTPLFIRLPGAYQGLMLSLAKDYQSVCAALRQNPNEELLRPILQCFKETGELERAGRSALR